MCADGSIKMYHPNLDPLPPFVIVFQSFCVEEFDTFVERILSSYRRQGKELIEMPLQNVSILCEKGIRFKSFQKGLFFNTLVLCREHFSIFTKGTTTKLNL